MEADWPAQFGFLSSNNDPLPPVCREREGRGQLSFVGLTACWLDLYSPLVTKSFLIPINVPSPRRSNTHEIYQCGSDWCTYCTMDIQSSRPGLGSTLIIVYHYHELYSLDLFGWINTRSVADLAGDSGLLAAHFRFVEHFRLIIITESVFVYTKLSMRGHAHGKVRENRRTA